MVKKLFRKALFGWHIEVHKKVTKRKLEYQLRIWKPIKRDAKEFIVRTNLFIPKIYEEKSAQAERDNLSISDGRK